MKTQIRQLYRYGRSALVSKFYSYDSDDLFNAVQSLGVTTGDTLMVHAALNPDNGFIGNHKDIINVLKDLVTYEGLLVMPSMPYADSSRAFLDRGKPMDVKRSPSHMGLISEVFRRNKEVDRSLSCIHPLLAWGKASKEFLKNHELCEYSFGKNSPFDKLQKYKAKILCFDVDYEFITFTHYVEDYFKQHYAFPLYDSEPIRGVSINESGEKIENNYYVLSDVSRELRCEEKLYADLKKLDQLKRKRIGNTKLLVVEANDILAAARTMISNGDSFFYSP